MDPAVSSLVVSPEKSLRVISRARVGRPHSVTLKFSDEELAILVRAAKEAGWKKAGWAATAAVAASKLVLEGPWTAPPEVTS